MMNTRIKFGLYALVLSGLAACGGGGGTAPLGPATVASVNPDRVSYGRLSTFTVAGSNLSDAVAITATGCDGLLRVSAGASSTQIQFSCTPNKALSLALSIAETGRVLYSSTMSVPKPRVTMSTSMGELVIELEPAIVTLTVDNFLAYVNSGFYDGSIFHRVIRNFVAQGGGFSGVTTNDLVAKTGLRPAIVLQTNLGLSNQRGSIAMARTSAANSATSQFYFNAVDNLSLDWASAASPGYAVFGRIVTGIAVLDAMNLVTTVTVGPYADVPLSNITIQTARQTL